MNHHPELELLEQYAAGTLPAPVALCVSVHLSYCAQCATEVQSLQALGGMLLEELAPAAVDGARIGAGAVVTSNVPAGATVVGVPARQL